MSYTAHAYIPRISCSETQHSIGLVIASLQTAGSTSFSCRLLRWGSSTVADLAATIPARLDSTAWPGLEMAQALNSSPGLHSGPNHDAQPIDTSLQSPAAAAAAADHDVVHQHHADAWNGASPGAVLGHWASLQPGSLPGASVRSNAMHNLHGHPHLNQDRHMAVERSGSRIPLLAEEAEADADAAQAAPVNQTPAQQEGSSQQESVYKAAVLWQAPVQRHPGGLSSGMSPTAADTGDPPAVMAAAVRQPSQEQQYKLSHRRSHKIFAKQRPPDGGGLQAVGVAQQAQALRRRHRSRLKVTGGGQFKGIMSLGKHRSGRVSPEKVLLLPVRQASGTVSQLLYPETAASIGTAHQVSAHDDHHVQLRALSLMAMLPTKSKPTLPAAPLAQNAVKRQRQSMRKMIRKSVEQVNACTAQLQEQSMQQQEAREALHAMTSTTIAMLDDAISAAVHKQQYHGQ